MFYTTEFILLYLVENMMDFDFSQVELKAFSLDCLKILVLRSFFVLGSILIRKFRFTEQAIWQG